MIWLPRPIAATMVIEADKWFDLETGGSLMGYWANDRDAVITAYIPAGPTAKRERYRFEPDFRWQQGEIDAHYRASNRLDDYLGDWHTHPTSVSAHLSWTDRATARRIIRAKSARQPKPLMVILVGAKGDWRIMPIICQMRRAMKVLPYLVEERMDCHVF
jgi:integrative and conjugative element protein (TIGR02256 family)